MTYLENDQTNKKRFQEELKNDIEHIIETKKIFIYGDKSKVKNQEWGQS